MSRWRTVWPLLASRGLAPVGHVVFGEQMLVAAMGLFTLFLLARYVIAMRRA